MERLSWIIQVAHCNHKGPYEGNRQEGQSQRRKCDDRVQRGRFEKPTLLSLSHEGHPYVKWKYSKRNIQRKIRRSQRKGGKPGESCAK